MNISIIVNNPKHGHVVYLSKVPKKINRVTWLKFKQIIYGKIFTYYNSEMDFSNSTVIYDNRKTYSINQDKTE